MAVTPISAVPALPYFDNISLTVCSGTGNINPGDWVAYSGQFVVATNTGQTAYWKTSGAGVSIEANRIYDPAGRLILNSALKILVEGAIWVTAAFSGQPANGIGAYPLTTGSGVAAPTGASGIGATWQTAQVQNNSALSGTANAQQAPVATVIASRNFSNAGTGELLIRLQALAPDVRG